LLPKGRTPHVLPHRWIAVLDELMGEALDVPRLRLDLVKQQCVAIRELIDPPSTQPTSATRPTPLNSSCSPLRSVRRSLVVGLVTTS
jgi:hypothetical protein